MWPRDYICPKCKNGTFKSDLSTLSEGGGWLKRFKIQNKRFTIFTCEKCTYTELRKLKADKLVS